MIEDNSAKDPLTAIGLRYPAFARLYGPIMAYLLWVQTTVRVPEAERFMACTTASGVTKQVITAPC